MNLPEADRRKVLLGLGMTAFAGAWAGSARWAAAQSSDPVRLLLGSHMEYLQALAPAYAAAFGPTPEIELVTTPDLPVKLNSTMIARRSPGDAVFVTAALVAGLAEKGWLTDLSDLVNDKLLPNGLIANSLTAARFQGKMYGVPVTIGAPIMHWNKNLLEGAGLDPEAPAGWHSVPGSFETMLEYALAVNDPDNNIYGITDNWGGVGSGFTFGWLLQAAGGAFLDADLNPVMNSAAGVEALTRMVELLHSFATAHGADAAQIREHVAKGELGDAQRVAHSLKGLAGTLGLAAMGTLAADIEHAIKHSAGELPAQVDTGIAALQVALTEACNHIATLPKSAGAAAISAPIDWTVLSTRIAQLRALLAADDHATVESFESLRGALEQAVGRSALRTLVQSVDDYAFDEALQELDVLCRSEPRLVG